MPDAILSAGLSVLSGLTVGTSLAFANLRSLSGASAVATANLVPTSAAKFVLVTLSGTTYGIALYEVSA